MFHPPLLPFGGWTPPPDATTFEFSQEFQEASIMYPDGERPLRVTERPDTIAVEFASDAAPLAAAFLRSTQAIIDVCEQNVEGDEWRFDAYRKIYSTLSDTNHAGTGSEQELQLHQALGVLSQLLRVTNE